MSSVTRFWPLLCGIHRYDKSLSTRGVGAGHIIEAPILAYLIETRNGRILYDVGCDYRKLADPRLRAQWYENPSFPFGPPEVTEEDRHALYQGVAPAVEAGLYLVPKVIE